MYVFLLSDVDLTDKGEYKTANFEVKCHTILLESTFYTFQKLYQQLSTDMKILRENCNASQNNSQESRKLISLCI